jgi:hypothetical protein
MTFRVGQKVVCVDANPHSLGYRGPGWHPQEAPIEGAVYTIRSIGISPDCPLLAVQLVELRRPYKWGYGVTRFRPVVERSTDITFAHEILREVIEKQPLIARNRQRIRDIASGEAGK